MAGGRRRGRGRFIVVEVLQEYRQFVIAASPIISLHSTLESTLLPPKIFLRSQLYNFYIIPSLLSDNSLTTFLKYLI